MQANSESSTSWSSDEQAIIQLLQSMGVSKFDSSIPAALNEYAKRYASEILSDSKDYSTYNGKKEIDAEDVRLAIKLSDAKISGVDAKTHAVEELKEDINKHSLESLLDSVPTSIRSLPLVPEQRSFTTVPGSEAYSQYLTSSQQNHQSSSSSMDI